METLWTMLLGLFTSFLGFLQPSIRDCSCPENQFTSTESIYQYDFSNGKSIVACGYLIEDIADSTLSEFVLAECGNDQIIGFWDAMTTCEITFSHDTLTLKELYQLPLSKNFKDQEVVWTIEKLYYNENDVLQRSKHINQNLMLFSDSQIKQTLTDYKNSLKELDAEEMRLLDRLFVAALSGDEQSKAFFLAFREAHPELDGAFLHQYRILQDMLQAWEAR